MAEPTYRYATHHDAEAVRALIELAYRGPESAKGWASEAGILTGPRTSLAEVDELIAQPDTRFLLAEHDGDLVGCVLIEKHGEDGYFGMFSIDPRVQTGGLGGALLAQAEDAARDLWDARGMTAVVINLRDNLIAWYERRGYTLTGRTEPFPFHQHSGALRTDFHLVELRKGF
ncbi:MAG TPA: GNAT family N-acetyltransferase [Acidimicrobiales bacterium]|nr:GNAT family N-acetyltransferase [Acidimicrobiales bacterium]